LKVPYELKKPSPVRLEPRNDFQKKVCMELLRIGVDNTSVYSAPFEIIGRERFSLITSLSRNGSKIKRNAQRLKGLSTFFSSRYVFIVKKLARKEGGVPVILESELPEISSPKELDKLIEEKISKI